MRSSKHSPDKAEPKMINMAKYGIIVDLDRCTGCMTCVIACKQENLTRPTVWWNKILELEDENLDRTEGGENCEVDK